MRRLLTAAAAHSPRSDALVALQTFCGLRISEALGADVRDFGHYQGHRVLRVVRKGGRVPLAPPVVPALELDLGDRTTGPIFLATTGGDRWSSKLTSAQIGRLCRDAGLPAGVTPHSLRHSYATEALRLGARLQDVQDALGHAPRPGATTAAAGTSTADPTTCWPLPSPQTDGHIPPQPPRPNRP